MRTIVLFLAAWLLIDPACADDDVLKSKFKRPSLVPHPGYNPATPAKVRLGKILFFDPRLSGTDTMACASCHNPDLGWEDGQARSVGEAGVELERHSPTLLNLAWGRRFGWDGRIPTLEGFVLGPISNAREMNQDPDSLAVELAAIPGYRRLFAEAFPGTAFSIDQVSLAIAAFERTIVSRPSPFDRWVAGDAAAISEAAKAGFRLFNGKAGCVQCHKGWNFTDDGFHDIGLASPDPGRGGVAGEAAKWRHAFKTPTLRDIARRAPYMHDGSLEDLAAVIDHYDGKFQRRAGLAKEIKSLSLSAEQKLNLKTFLHTLTSGGKPVSVPDIPE